MTETKTEPSIWQTQPDIEAMNAHLPALAKQMGIAVTAVTSTQIEARMPVNEWTIQPFRYLHGGASCYFAETIASMASQFCLKEEGKGFGMTLTASHLRSAPFGSMVMLVAKPLHLGRSSQVWQIRLSDESARHLAEIQLTVAITKGR